MGLIGIFIVINLVSIVFADDYSASASSAADASASAFNNPGGYPVPPIYKECGTACPKTCAQPEDRICTLECRPGYFCPDGLFMNSDGLCVKLKDCNRPHSHPLTPANGPTPNPWNNFPGFQVVGLNNLNPIANGQPSPPPAVIRSSGFGFPVSSLPAMTPRIKPLIDLDPTVPRPVLRVSNEQSSDDDQ